MHHNLFYHFPPILAFLTIFSLSIPVKGQIEPNIQIEPDITLGNDNSRVTRNVQVRGAAADLIEDGVQNGSNLFHSFLEFGVTQNQRVYFANPDGIESILSRVTGTNQSNISGILGVDGPADLFFLNPNGIVFGEDASLDIDGSFYATTAEAIELGEGIFSATEPDQSTLLAVTPSVNFSNYLTDNSGDIENRGFLEVGEELTLAARNISIIDGLIFASDQGELGDIILSADDTIEIRATEGNSAGLFSTVNSAGTSGDIIIAAGTLKVIDTDSQIDSGDVILATVSFNGGDSGNIIIDVVDTVFFDGLNGGTTTAGETVAGSAGNIYITATNLEMLNGSRLLTNTLVQQTGGNTSNSGNVTINLAGTLDLRGVGKVYDENMQKFELPNLIGTSSTEEEGNAGNVQITAAQLQFSDGAAITASTVINGRAGNIILDINGNASFTGVTPNGQNGSGLFSRTFGAGDGGDISIRAANLEVLDGANISAQAFDAGDAGNIALEIVETVHIDGLNPVTQATSSSISTDTSFNSTRNRNSSGDSGDIHVTAENLEITNEGFLSAANRGTGDTGNIAINLQRRLTAIDGEIQTISTDASGGNIEIVAKDIRLIGDSDVLTNVETGGGRGGDITLRANTIVALNDSDILAFSADGEGGNILLNTLAFFGQNFQPSPEVRTRAELEALNGNERVDVNATGRIASGTVITPEPDFIENSLTELPSNLVNTETLIAGSCVNRTNNIESEDSFVITGRGGSEQTSESISMSLFSTNTVQTLPGSTYPQVLQEPEGIYQLANSRLVLSRECAL